ncbi:hypothetical protein [Pelargonium vein banding virus]|uniref:hypothetical protein n=1 Tax=Pelargonium vein banding virus TaxID=671126 RepID=UPI0001B72005|nr:hypothetical protein [Pelargonium vein banding virus]ACV74335.1 unknown [Pelargonium vein banding virus]
MSERFEQAIQKWYNESRTADLRYLDLATESPTVKDYCSVINNNVSVIYDRLLLHSKVAIKDTYKILEAQEANQDILVQEIRRLSKRVKALEAEALASKPLTAEQVRELVKEIAAQPKLVEEQAFKLTTDLRSQVLQVKELVEKVQHLLVS